MTLAELRELESKATSGEWIAPLTTYDQPEAVVLRDNGPMMCSDTVCTAEQKEDQAFIAAARNHFAALLDVAEAAKLEHEIIKNFVLAIIMGETVRKENAEQKINEAVDAMDAALRRLESIDAETPKE